MSAEYLLAVIALTLLVILILAFFWSRTKSAPRQIAHQIYVEGLLALASGDEQLAYQKFRSVVSQDTENVDAYLKLGDILRKRGKPEKALQVHRELNIRPTLTHQQRVDINKSLADDYLACTQYERAVEILEELWKEDKDSIEVAEKLLAAYEKTDQWEKALEVQNRVSKIKSLRNSSRAALYKVMQGRSLANQGEHHKARLAYKEALNLDDKCVPAYLYLGDAYMADDREDDAVEYWNKLLEQVPEAGFLVYPRLEKVLYDLGRFGEIINIYQSVLEKDPGELRTMYALAKIYEKKGNTNLAIDAFRGILEQKPDFYAAAGNLIALYCQNGMNQDARLLLEKLHHSLPSLNSELVCKNCGAISTEPPWRCPTCGRINVYQW
ncbi:MAG: tetratricopeptide repeat protein [candidate division Zixibacteria bacterium]|nr:tetratricopeptide repeat protein [candidate division Zixibacteria bacterium]